MDLAELRQAKTAAEVPEPRAVDDDSAPYVRSYLKLRLLVGLVGLALPPLLWLADRTGSAEPWLRKSLSAYYYSAGSDLFVAGICVIGGFLITYTVARYWLENRASTIAGAAAILVALCPTSPEGDDVVTPLQAFIGVELLKAVHVVAAVVFIGLLVVISHFFGVREGKRQQRGRSPLFWRRFHHSCRNVIVGAIVFICVVKFFDLSDNLGWFGERYVWFGEVAAIYGFAVSWLAKGMEITKGFPDAK